MNGFAYDTWSVRHFDRLRVNGRCIFVSLLCLEKCAVDIVIEIAIGIGFSKISISIIKWFGILTAQEV
jgi:hypothetical protein